MRRIVETGKGIAWGRVVAIAAVQSAITLMWIVYRAYLGKMLGDWGFSEHFTAQLLLFEMALGLVMEPVFGLLSDRQQRFLGSRAPLITLGVILSAAIFVGLPLLAVVRLPLRWLLPTGAIAWALAMTTFRTPILVWLLKSAPKQSELPLAMAVLTMVGGLMTVIKGNIQAFFLDLGAFPAFLLSSIALLGAAVFLRYFMPPLETPAESSTAEPLPWWGCGQVFLMAIALAWGSTALMGSWKLALTGNALIGINGLNLVLALTAIPVGWLALRWAKYPLLAIALGWLAMMAYGLSLAVGMGFWVVPLVVLWAWAFGTMKNGALPYIFDVIPAPWAGFGIGIFFGVTGLANQVFPQFFPVTNTTLQGLLGVFCLAIAALLALLPIDQRRQSLGNNEV